MTDSKVPLAMAARNGLLVPKEYSGPRKLLIGFAQGGHPEPAFYESLLQFLLTDGSPQGRHVFNGITSYGSVYVENVRNACVKAFLASPTGPQDALLFIDTDHRFTPQHIYALLDSLDDEHPIVGGLYFNYWEDGHLYPVCLEWNGQGGLQTCSHITPNNLREVQVVGTGFMMIQRRVLDAMAEAKMDDANWTWFGRDVVAEEHAGEDSTFCLRAAKLGFKVWLNSNVIIDHCKKRWIGWNDFVEHWRGESAIRESARG